MSELQKALDYANQNHERFLNQLIDVLKIPSISTSVEFNSDVQRAAEWMANYLKQLGIEHVEHVHGALQHLGRRDGKGVAAPDDEREVVEHEGNAKG